MSNGFICDGLIISHISCGSWIICQVIDFMFTKTVTWTMQGRKDALEYVGNKGNTMSQGRTKIHVLSFQNHLKDIMQETASKVLRFKVYQVYFGVQETRLSYSIK